MALYISAGQRRRRLYGTAAIAAVVALLVGIGLGRMTAPTPADQAKGAKDAAKAVTGQLQALPLHYEQASKGQMDRANFTASLRAGLNRAETDLDGAMMQAAWLDTATKQRLREGISQIRLVADRDAPPPEFAAAVQGSVAQIEAAFGAVPTTSTTAP